MKKWRISLILSTFEHPIVFKIYSRFHFSKPFSPDLSQICIFVTYGICLWYLFVLLKIWNLKFFSNLILSINIRDSAYIRELIILGVFVYVIYFSNLCFSFVSKFYFNIFYLRTLCPSNYKTFDIFKSSNRGCPPPPPPPPPNLSNRIAEYILVVRILKSLTSSWNPLGKAST